jgi:hypothetical protein
MKTVIVIIAIHPKDGKQIIGVADSNKSATKLVSKSGYGWNMSQHELELLEILGYTVNRKVNFKFEIWKVHGN